MSPTPTATAVDIAGQLGNGISLTALPGACFKNWVRV
jgi:hypothetical protein